MAFKLCEIQLKLGSGWNLQSWSAYIRKYDRLKISYLSIQTQEAEEKKLTSRNSKKCEEIKNRK